MPRLAATEGLTEIQQEILSTVRGFVDKEILPYATDLEHKDEFPEAIVDGMKEMGLFGLMIPEEFGGLGESLLTYALVVEQIARGWMSVSGVINTHFIVAYMLMHHGTDEQKSRLLPLMATGELRGGFSMSEPGCGSDVAAIKSKAVRDGEEYVLDGQKMWLTNGARAGLIATLVKTDEGGDSVYKNMTTFLGGEAGRGRGFYQMMDGVEVGRVNVAARACGISIRAFELAIAYAQQRQTFGKPLSGHQAIQFKLAEMATKVEASHALMVNAARLKDAGKRNDVEAGMAKLLASEYCAEVTQESFRIHGGYGYSKEYEIERLMREAPFLLIGEGTSEIQKTIISRGLLKDYKLQG
ncbi:MAG: acyl-CoA dehydrogenase family protein [Actinobacteria bacterium]|nr:acyl-CoA dehydrogenase family protein [Actinomycetota bacterium]